MSDEVGSDNRERNAVILLTLEVKISWTLLLSVQGKDHRQMQLDDEEIHEGKSVSDNVD